MNLFISYSRDDKAWTYKFWRSLLKDTAHHVWLDQRIVPASNWWLSILSEIEKCEVFVYVMSSKAVGSIYCLAELHYAVALNKPVLPLMLKSCVLPDVLSSKQVHYEDITNRPSMGRVLLRVEQGLRHVELALARGEFPLNPAVRPSEPKPAVDPTETLQIAEDAAAKGNYTLAESLLLKVIESDKGILGETAKERLEEVQQERERSEEYRKIKVLADNPTTFKMAQKAWKQFVERFGTSYDPDNLKSRGISQEEIIETPSLIFPRTKPEYSKSHPDIFDLLAEWTIDPNMAGLPNLRESKEALSTHSVTKEQVTADAELPAKGNPTDDDLAVRRQRLSKPNQISTLDPLPPPFEWIAIPLGKVTLSGNTGWHESRLSVATTFDVPAFAIAKYPITNAQFAPFIEAGGYMDRRWWMQAGWQQKEVGNWKEPRYWRKSPWNIHNHPVVGVSWYEAVAFCLWLSDLTGENILLPTEQQWQRAAQGDDGRAYPWGNVWGGRHCSNSVTPYHSDSTSPVFQYETGDKNNSSFGVVDMAGNVWEWCWAAYDVWRSDLGRINVHVLRGGSWINNRPSHFRVDFRNWLYPDGGDNNISFRLIRSYI